MAQMIDDSQRGETFTLRFCRSTGKRKGSMATVAKCRYGAPKGHREHESNSAGTGSTQRTPRWLHSEKGTLPMTDVEKGAKGYFTPLISHMMFFNEYKIKH